MSEPNAVTQLNAHHAEILWPSPVEPRRSLRLGDQRIDPRLNSPRIYSEDILAQKSNSAIIVHKNRRTVQAPGPSIFLRYIYETLVPWLLCNQSLSHLAWSIREDSRALRRITLGLFARRQCSYLECRGPRKFCSTVVFALEAQ